MKNKGLFNNKKRLCAFLLIFFVFPGVVCLWILHSKYSDARYSNSFSDTQNLDAMQDVSHNEVKPKPLETEIKGDESESTDLTWIDNLELPSPFEKEIYFTKYEPGSLVYAVDHYVKEEQESIKLISSETFQDSLSHMCDWNSNYRLSIQNYEPAPAIPSSLKLIIYSRRFAKLIEHGNSGFTDKEISGIIRQLGSDLAKWKKVYAGGQSLRDKTLYFNKKDRSSEELILPLSYRINTSILLIGQFSIKEGLPVIIETAETFGEDTNWSAVGYACDKILTSLNQDSLSSERRKIVNDYQTWRQSEKPKTLDYEVVELPSYKSPLRPFERATSLGANLDLSKGTIKIEMPPQYIYLKLRDGAGYHDLRGNSEILKKVINFAKVYNEAKN